MKGRYLSGLALALALVGSLVAPAHASQSRAAVTLTIATVSNPDMVEMQRLSPTFEKQYGINVKFLTLPENTLRQKLTADVSTGGGQFDLVTVSQFEIPFWAKNGWITNLDPLFAKMSAADSKAYDISDLLPKIRQLYVTQGHQFAIPFYGESSMTLYNKALFKKAGLTMPLHPTWDQMATFAAKLNDPAHNVSGICLRGLPGWGEMGVVLSTVTGAFGGAWFDMQWHPLFTSAPNVKAVTFYINLLRKYGEPGAANSGFTECETNMAQAKTAMWVDATVAAGLLSDPTTSKVANDLGFAYAPTEVTAKGSHWLGGWSLAMEGASKHQDAAFQFMTWATSKVYIQLVAKDKGWASVPPGTRISTYQNPNYLKAAPFASIVYGSMLTADPNDPNLLKVPYTGVAIPEFPEWQTIGTELTQNLSGAIAGSTTVLAALQKTQDQATHLMKQDGYIK